MRVNEEGGPLRPERVEVAPPGPGRVRVDVVACGVRGADVRTARGVGAALPATPGHEVTGVVADPGGWAQSLTAPSDALARIPDGLDFLDAAPMGCAGVTTFNAVRHAGLAAGARVAVFGLGGLGPRRAVRGQDGPRGRRAGRSRTVWVPTSRSTAAPPRRVPRSPGWGGPDREHCQRRAPLIERMPLEAAGAAVDAVEGGAVRCRVVLDAHRPR